MIARAKFLVINKDQHRAGIIGPAGMPGRNHLPPGDNSLLLTHQA